jgi:hypothetical protein
VILTALWYALIAADVILLGRMSVLRLAAKYPAFTAWLVVDIIYSVLPIPFTGHPEVYARAYALGSVASLVAQVFLIRGLFMNHLAHYRGVGKFGAGALLLFSAGSLLGALTFFAVTDYGPRYGWIRSIIIAQQIASAAATLFLVGTALLFAFISVPTRRNVLMLERIMAVYFAALSVNYWLLNSQAGRNAATISPVLEACALSCLIALTFALSRRGELVGERPLTDDELREVAELPEYMRLLKSFRWSPRQGLH